MASAGAPTGWRLDGGAARGDPSAMKKHSGIAALFLACPVAAQLIVVDAANGPGTNYTSLAAATAAAPDGATLLVRMGAYVGDVLVVGKGLAILADPGVQIVQGGLRVQNTLPTQRVLVRRLSIDATTFQFFGAIYVNACQGRVVFEQITATTPWNTNGPLGLNVASSTHVELHDSTINSGGSVAAAVFVAESSTILGRSAIWPSMAGAAYSTTALTVGTGANVHLMDCVVRGGSGSCPLGCLGGIVPVAPNDNKPAVTLTGGAVTARGQGSLVGGAMSVQGAAVTGTGSLRLAPSVNVVGAITSTPAAVVVAMPSVRSSSAPPGGTITAISNGTPGDALFLVLGLPGPELVVPGVADSVWIEPAGHLWAAFGVTPPLAGSVVVPPLQALLGVELAWQTIAFSAATGLAVSQPSIAFVY
jgi:hypothetical protein